MSMMFKKMLCITPSSCKYQGLSLNLSKVFSAKNEFLFFKTCYIMLSCHSPSPQCPESKIFSKAIDIVSE